MNENSVSVPIKPSSVYLVFIVDTTDGASYYRIVCATSGYLAGAYALQHDPSGDPQDVGPYQVVAALCLDRVRQIVEEMNSNPPPDVGDVDTSAITDEIPYDALISP